MCVCLFAVCSSDAVAVAAALLLVLLVLLLLLLVLLPGGNWILRILFSLRTSRSTVDCLRRFQVSQVSQNSGYFWLSKIPTPDEHDNNF